MSRRSSPLSSARTFLQPQPPSAAWMATKMQKGVARPRCANIALFYLRAEHTFKRYVRSSPAHRNLQQRACE